MKSRVVQVTIHGQKYAVRSDLEPQYIGELAAYVDDKMGQAARELSSADSLRIAIIAALNIADELSRARVATGGREIEILDRAAGIEQLLDSILDTQPLPKAAAGGG